MNDLEMYREQLAICDDRIIDALVERNSIVEKIMAYKETYGMPILQPAQEAKQQHRKKYRMYFREFSATASGSRRESCSRTISS